MVAESGSGDLVRWFEDLRLSDVDAVAGKGANLGELTHAAFPVPPGFVVTSAAYLETIERSGARARLVELMARLDPDDPAALAAAAAEARRLVRESDPSDELVHEVEKACLTLSENAQVAVRSSGTSEDAGDTSFAGMNATFTNVVGVAELWARVRDCWASLYGERVVAYRATGHLVDEPAMAVIVQVMVASEVSGVIFTVDPTSQGSDRLVLESVLGQGEAIVSGMVEPDTYVVHKDGPRLLSARVGHQARKIVCGRDGADEVVDLLPAEGTQRQLDDEQVLALARLALAVEVHYGVPQDIEWAIAGGKTWLVQSRPITTLHAATAPETFGAGAPTVLLRGLSASTGRASGAVRVLTDPDQRDRLLPGEVLVAPMTSPDWMSAIRRASALVTDGGGMTCHAAIVSRELGVPCVVGTRTATTTLRDGEVVTVDAAAGRVLAGQVDATDEAARETVAPSTAGTGPRASGEPLATRVYVNLAVADHADAVAAMETASGFSGRSSWWPMRCQVCTRGC